MKKECLLSVVIPNYNHGHYLKEKIPSLLKALPSDAELIIIDDASTDNSISIIRDYIEEDTRIRLICNPYNLGVIKTANLSLNYARGLYIFFSAADDIALPGMIEKYLKALLINPSISLCCSDCAAQYTGFPDRNPDLIYSDKLIKDCETIQVFTSDELIKLIKKNQFYIPGHTVIVKKEDLVRYGAFNESLGYLCDWFVFYTIALQKGIIYIPETLAIWRVTHTTFSSTQSENLTFKRLIYLKILQILNQPEQINIRTLLKKADALHFCFSPLFFKLFKFPKYYDLIVYEIFKRIKKRCKKHIRSIKKRLPFKKILAS